MNNYDDFQREVEFNFEISKFGGTFTIVKYWGYSDDGYKAELRINNHVSELQSAYSSGTAKAHVKDNILYLECGKLNDIFLILGSIW